VSKEDELNVQISFGQGMKAADIDQDLYQDWRHGWEVISNHATNTTTNQDTVRKMMIARPEIRITPSTDQNWNRPQLMTQTTRLEFFVLGALLMCVPGLFTAGMKWAFVAFLVMGYVTLIVATVKNGGLRPGTALTLLIASNVSFSSVQGSSRPPRKSYWRSYCLFL